MRHRRVRSSTGDGAQPARVLNLPFDLFRHELLMTQTTISDEFIASVVDELFLPLVGHYMKGR